MTQKVLVAVEHLDSGMLIRKIGIPETGTCSASNPNLGKPEWLVFQRTKQH
jgi:hypothetical protein